MTATSFAEVAMRKVKSIVLSGVLVACLPFPLPAGDRAMPQEKPALENAPPDLSGLQLSDVRRLELEEAFKRRDYKRAEAILVDEAERDPSSIRTARLLATAGGTFFLDGQYLN